MTLARKHWLVLAYAAFTCYAAVFAVLGGGEDRAWALWAAGGYGAGALVLWLGRGRPWAIWVALGVSLALALVAPLIWNSVVFKLEDGMVVIDRGAHLLLHHGSPYLPSSQVTSWFDYNPYLPVMALFGLPHAAGLPGLLGNAGVWLAVATVLVLGAAFRVTFGPARRRVALCAAAIAVASPVIALNLAVITTDPPVLACMLLCLALAGRGEVIWSAIALAVACVLKDTAWLAIPVMAAMFWARDSVRAAVRFVVALLAAAVVLIAALAPATLVRPAAMGAMIRDTVLFPLGLTKYKTPAESLLPGHLLTSMGTAGHVLSVGLLLAAGLAVAVSLFIWPLRDVRSAAWRMAIGLTLMFALGPDVRFGYFLYPLGLAGWVGLTSPGLVARLIGDGEVDDAHELTDQRAEYREPGQPDQAFR